MLMKWGENKLVSHYRDSFFSSSYIIGKKNLKKGKKLWWCKSSWDDASKNSPRWCDDFAWLRANKRCTLWNNIEEGREDKKIYNMACPYPQNGSHMVQKIYMYIFSLSLSTPLSPPQFISLVREEKRDKEWKTFFFLHSSQHQRHHRSY